ncbi:phosphotyrosine protein phosphatase [Streptomyces sp. NPDC001410]|uniref:arsenate reductase/protein-tyrosine-phosphatase family protein n=1 Tax=Streptomyces sp. NPDC001410 TaxID=3364574 RepID=UPI0036BFDF9E
MFGRIRRTGPGRSCQVRSAGSAPADAVNAADVEAMAEAGTDISAEMPKVLTVEAVQASDVVITMGCGDTCPVFPGKRYLGWELPDPAGQGVDAVRPIRDEIEKRIRGLLDEIGPAEQPDSSRQDARDVPHGPAGRSSP